MKRILIVGLLGLAIVSCANQQEITPTMNPIPTLHPTIFPTRPHAMQTQYPIDVEALVAISTYLPERIEVLEGLWALNDERLQFIRSRISFVLPDEWDVINMTSDFNATDNIDTHIIPHNPVINTDGKEIVPTIKFVFEPVPAGTDSLEYFTHKSLNNNLCEINNVFQKGTGILNLDAAIGYKCNYTSEGIQHTAYTIYFTSNFDYETTGAQITMDSPSEIFSQIDPEFNQFMQSLSITY